VPEAKGHPYYIHEWYARWLNNSLLLVIRLSRVNLARAASRLRLIVVDTSAGKVVKASEDFKWAGEHLSLSPDRKMALTRDDNYLRRRKGEPGSEYLTSNTEGRTHVFDLERLTPVSSWREPPDATGHERFALDARWRPDGKTILTVGTDVSDDHLAPKVRLWDAKRGQLEQTFSGHTGHILDVAFTAAGDKLLTASDDRTLRVWDTRTGRAEAVLRGHAAGLNRVVVLPGDRWAVSAAEEPVAKVWDLRAGKLWFDLPGHDSAVRDVVIESGAVVRTVTLRGTVVRWDCSTGKRLQVTPRPPDFPKRFGICELSEAGGALQMSIIK
jgi:WD40 repeat protein